MTAPIIIEEFTFKGAASIEIPLTKKEIYPRYKLSVTKLALDDEASIEMLWGQNSGTHIPSYVTDVTWEANQGDDGKRVTCPIAESIDLVGRPIEKDLPHQVILLIDIERTKDGEITMTWETAFCSAEGKFFASKGKAFTNFRRINHMRIFPSIPTWMDGNMKLIGYTK